MIVQPASHSGECCTWAEPQSLSDINSILQSIKK